MKVYLSSTYQDLVEHRAAVDRTLRRMGHDVIGMEQYVAEGSKPVDRCQADVRLADVYVIVVAWRYGFVPAAETRSITEIELAEAQLAGKPVLAFLLDPEHPWPPGRVDAMGGQGAQVAKLRSELGANYLSGVFRTPEDLASQVAAAVSAQGLTRHMVERVLEQTSVASSDMESFAKGESLTDTTLMGIKAMIRQAGAARALVVDIGNGEVWWSTRLYLLASLLRALTSVRQIVFRDLTGAFVGMASPAAMTDSLAGSFPLLQDFRRTLRSEEGSADVERETERQTQRWTNLAGANEAQIKVSVRAPLLERWLGERWVNRCIRVDGSELSMTQVQQIVDSLLPDVPLERAAKAPVPGRELLVVDRDAFALVLAREWVRSGLPRSRVI